jgi:hypothetical protein
LERASLLLRGDATGLLPLPLGRVRDAGPGPTSSSSCRSRCRTGR